MRPKMYDPTHTVCYCRRAGGKSAAIHSQFSIRSTSSFSIVKLGHLRGSRRVEQQAQCCIVYCGAKRFRPGHLFVLH